jgi:hypothetical protein
MRWRGAHSRSTLIGMSASTESMRWELLETVERCYYLGPTAGKRWLVNLAALLESMPWNDPRLVRLALFSPRLAELGDFIALHPPTAADELEPISWLDDYVDWATHRPRSDTARPQPDEARPSEVALS